nr:hypothetical protein [Bartonella sp. DB5-6]
MSKHPFAGAYTGNKPDAKPEDYGKRADRIVRIQSPYCCADLCAITAF